MPRVSRSFSGVAIRATGGAGDPDAGFPLCEKQRIVGMGWAVTWPDSMSKSWENYVKLGTSEYGGRGWRTNTAQFATGVNANDPASVELGIEGLSVWRISVKIREKAAPLEYCRDGISLDSKNLFGWRSVGMTSSLAGWQSVGGRLFQANFRTFGGKLAENRVEAGLVPI
jgi:hypothetical protein